MKPAIIMTLTAATLVTAQGTSASTSDPTHSATIFSTPITTSVQYHTGIYRDMIPSRIPVKNLGTFTISSQHVPDPSPWQPPARRCRRLSRTGHAHHDPTQSPPIPTSLSQAAPHLLLRGKSLASRAVQGHRLYPRDGFGARGPRRQAREFIQENIREA